MKLQERKADGGLYINLPKEHIELLKWGTGDTVIVESDKEKDIIILRRI